MPQVEQGGVPSEVMGAIKTFVEQWRNASDDADATAVNAMVEYRLGDALHALSVKENQQLTLDYVKGKLTKETAPTIWADRDVELLEEKSRISQLQAQIESLKANHGAAVDEKEASIADLNAKIKQLQSDGAEKDSNIEKLTKEAEELRNSGDAYSEQLKSEIKKLNTEIEQLNTGLASKDNDIENIKTSASADLEKLKEDVSAKAAQIEKLTAEIQKLNAENVDKIAKLENEKKVDDHLIAKFSQAVDMAAKEHGNNQHFDERSLSAQPEITHTNHSAATETRASLLLETANKPEDIRDEVAKRQIETSTGLLERATNWFTNVVAAGRPLSVSGAPPATSGARIPADMDKMLNKIKDLIGKMNKALAEAEKEKDENKKTKLYADIDNFHAQVGKVFDEIKAATEAEAAAVQGLAELTPAPATEAELTAITNSLQADAKSKKIDDKLAKVAQSDDKARLSDKAKSMVKHAADLRKEIEDIKKAKAALEAAGGAQATPSAPAASAAAVAIPGGISEEQIRPTADSKLDAARNVFNTTLKSENDAVAKLKGNAGSAERDEFKKQYKTADLAYERAKGANNAVGVDDKARVKALKAKDPKKHEDALTKEVVDYQKEINFLDGDFANSVAAVKAAYDKAIKPKAASVGAPKMQSYF